MSIIYSYPETTSLNDNDTLIGTSSALVGGKKKNITRNFSLGEIRDYVSSGGVINPDATDFKLAVFNQNGTKITDSIVSQDALTGTGIVVAGTLRSTAATFNGLITGSQGALIYGGDINLNSTTKLGGPVKDAIGNQGFAGQILLSDSSGRVSWTNYSAGLTYQGTWNAATNTPTLTSGQGVNGHFYIVNVAGNTSLDGETDWKVGDWAVFVEQGINDKWEKIDNTSVLIGEGTPNTIAMWVGGTTPSTTLNNSIITELNNVISIAGDLSTQGLEVNKYLRDGAGNDGTDGQVLTSTTVNGDKEVVWTTPTTGTVTGSGTGQVLSKFSGTGTGQTVLEDSLVSESSSNSLISGLTKSIAGTAGSIQFQQLGPCNPAGGGQVNCVMNDVPNVNLSTDPFSGSGASVVQGITFNFLSTSDANDFKTLYGITTTGLCSFGGSAAASSFDLTLLFDNGATITFNVPQGQIGGGCNNEVSLGLFREGQNASMYGTALTYVSGSGSISNGDSTVGSIKVSIAATLDMSTNKITNVVDPTDAQDAATKSYVDSTTVSGSGTIGTLPVFTSTDILGDSSYKQSVSGDTVDILTKTVTDANAYTINTNIGKLTRSGIYPNPGMLTSNVTIGAQYTYGNVDVHGSRFDLKTYNLPNSAGSPITLWSSSTAGTGISIRTDGGSISNLAGTYLIQATGAGSGTDPEAVLIFSNTGIKFQGQGNAANINFRSYNTNLLDSGDINFISETEEGQAGNITISSIATDAAGTAGEIRLAGAGISTSATDAVPLGLVIASNGHVKTGSVGDTYTLGSSTDGSNVKLNLDAANGTDSAVTLTGAGGLTIAQTNDIVTLTAPAGSDTTYTLAAGVKSATSVPLNLTPSTGSGTAVNLTEGTGITLTQTSATEITIDGVAQGVTGSGTVNKLPKFDTSTSLNDSIIEQGGGTTTITPIQAGAISFNMQTSSFTMPQFQTKNTITGPTPQVGDVFNFVLQQDLTWAVGGGVIPAGTYPFTVTFVGSGSMSCNFNSYSTGSGATGTGYTNLIGNGSSTSVNSSSTLSIDGELSMLTHQITNVVNPTNAQDAATKNYVDAIPTGVMTFGTSDSGATITVSGNAPDPRVKANTTGGVAAGSTSLATGAQIQTAITNSAATLLPLAGGTMTGAIALPGSPTLTLQAATKGYVDNTLAGSGSLIFQGSYDAVNNVPNLTSGTGILKGWTYAVTAGPSTSFWSPPLDVGDLVIANIDNPASASDWTEVQSNIGVAGSGTTDLGTVKGLAGFNSNDFTVSNSGWVEAKDFSGSTPGYVPDATAATAGTFLKEDGTWSTTGTVTGTGTQNYVTKWSAGGAGIGDSIIFDNGTDVGIGTNTPSSTYGETTLDVTDSSGDASLSLKADSNKAFEISSRSGDVLLMDLHGRDLRFGTGGNEKMRIATTGNVGIGIQNPGARLDVAAQDPVIRITNTKTNLVQNDVIGGLEFFTKDASSGASRVLSAITSDNTISSAVPSGNLIFKTSNGGGGAVAATEKMRIDRNGNVGIGTDSPSGKVHIYEAASGQSIPNAAADTLVLDGSSSTGISILNNDVGVGSIFFGDNNDNFVGGFRYDHSDDSLDINVNNATALSIDSSRNVGIGTSSPGGKLEISDLTKDDLLELNGGATTNPYMLFAQNGVRRAFIQYVNGGLLSLVSEYGDIRFMTGTGGVDTEKMRIDSSGNVGIGTNSPAVSLDISATDAVQMPVGLTGDRPAGVNGMLRYNSSDNEFEGYIDGSWGSIGGSSASGTGTAVSYFNGATGQASTSLTSDPNIVIDGGYLGVGTNQPNTQLHVKSTVNELLKLESITSSQKIRFTDINNQSDDCDFGSTSGDLAMFTNNFGTQNTQTFTFNKDGKLGINQTSPSYNLDIQDSNFDPAIRIFATNSTSEILLQASQSSGSNNLINSNTNDLDFQGNGSSIMTLGVNTNAGSVTLGQYGQGSKTGAATYNLAVDSVGQIIEVSASSAPSIHKETFLNLASNTINFLLPPNINPIDENYVNVFIDGVYQNTNNINSVTTNPSNVTTVSLVSAAPAGTNVEIVATT